MKVKRASDVKKFTDIPNIGPAMAKDFELLGLKKPSDLKNLDGIKLYYKLCKLTGGHQDPCVADTFMAAIDFMNGGAAKPWWEFTAKRKKLLHNKS